MSRIKAQPAEAGQTQPSRPSIFDMKDPGEVELPVATVPSLEGLEVAMPPPPELSPQDVLERFHELRREVAVRQARRPGQAVAEGDEVVIDVLGFLDGRFLPFSARTDWQLELAPLPAFPGLFEGLLGMKVGESQHLPVKLPADYPAAPFRGAEVRFFVELKEAWRLNLLGEESQELLIRLGRGSTLEDLMDSIALELLEEREEQWWVEATRRVLGEVAVRTQVELPEALVREEIRRQWARTEGRVMELKGVPAAMQEADLRGWLEDEPLRMEAARRLRASLGLKALIESQGLRVTQGSFQEMVDDVARVMEFTPGEVKALVKGDRLAARKAVEVALRLQAVDYVMQHASFQVELPSALGRS